MPKPSKLEPHVHLLGTRTDAEIAALAGLSREAVRIYRTRRGIPAARNAARVDDLPPEPGETGEPTPSDTESRAATTPPARVKRRRGGQVEDVAGPVPDVSLAAEHKPRPAKQNASAQRGQGRKNAEALLEPFRERLGKVDDGQIAEQSGLSRGVVGSYRRKHGIKAYDGYLWASGGDAGVRARRGEQDTGAAASAHAAPPRAAGTNQKRKAGQKPGKKATPVQGAEPKRRGPPSRIDAVRHLVGSLSDREVADRVGLSASAVQMYRKKHNIPAPSKREAAPPELVAAAVDRPAAVIKPAALPLAAPAPTATSEPVPTVRPLVAWRLTLRVGGVEVERYAITADSASVARLGDAAGEVLRIERVGEGLA